MKVFGLGLFFELIKEPSWLANFRKRYDDPVGYHVSLKLPTYIDGVNLAKLKEVAKETANTSNPFTVDFDKYFFNKTSTGNLIMISARHNDNLVSLQKEVVKRTKSFGKTIKPYYEEFENNFNPHITIARKLDYNEFLEAKSGLKKPIYCQANIDKLRLHIMKKMNRVDELKDEAILYYELNSSS
jgi:2'-5' RNA ligase